MNDVAPLVQMKLPSANDVMLRINDVALRANGHASGVIWRETIEKFTDVCYTDENTTLEDGMIYKNGIKEYSLTGILFAIPMGVLYGLMYLDVLVGVIGGLTSGLVFALLIFLFVKVQEKKFDKMREEIARERRIVCDGGATVKGNGGWMFLTEHGIEFYPHKINFSRRELIIPIDSIESVKTNRNRIVLCASGQSLAIVVAHKNEWKAQIEAALAARAIADQ